MTDPRPEWVEAVRHVLADEGADSEHGWHSWRCFDLVRYPERCDCTETAARLALAAVIDQIKAEVLDERAVKLAEASIHMSHVTGQALSRCVDLVEHIAKDEMIREAKAEARAEGRREVLDALRMFRDEADKPLAVDLGTTVRAWLDEREAGQP